MTFSLGTLLKTVKNYEVDRTKTNEEYVNQVLGCLLCASNFEDQSWPASYGKTYVSNILHCRRNAPKELKGALMDPKSEECLLNNISIYVEENLRQGCFNELSCDVIGLCNRGNNAQAAIFEKLKVAMSNNTAKNEDLDDENFKLSNFLAVALIEAVQIPNIIKTDQVIKQRGNSVLYLHCGDIFKFAFNKKSNNKRIVVVPVNTRFDTHVSRKFESDVKQIVSDKTLHGMWVERMIRRSKTKQKVDNEWSDTTKQSRALAEEIMYGIDVCDLPVIVTYPDIEFVGCGNRLSEKAISRWNNLPCFKKRIHDVPTAHLPFRKEHIERALRDPRFSVCTKSENCTIGFNTNYDYDVYKFGQQIDAQLRN